MSSILLGERLHDMPKTVLQNKPFDMHASLLCDLRANG
jgi:hypothetical protein